MILFSVNAIQVSAEEPASDSSLSSGMEKAIQGTASNFNLIPSIAVSESYNSNVFFVDPAIVKKAGFEPEDYTSTVTPKIVMVVPTEFGVAHLINSGTFTHYVNNPSLDYTGVDGQLGINLTKAIARMDPNTSLNIRQSYSYTPTLAGFAAPSPVPPQDQDVALAQKVAPYVSGLQGVRQNSLYLQSFIVLRERITPRTLLNFTYAYDRVEFFAQPSVGVGTQQNFNINSHALSGQVMYALSLADRLSVSYAYANAEYFGSGSQDLPGFTTQTASGVWNHQFSPTTGFTASVGATLRTPNDELNKVYSATLYRNTTNGYAAASFSRSIVPVLTGTSGSSVSDLYSVSAGYKVMPTTVVGGAFNFARNQIVSTTSTVSTSTNNDLHSYYGLAYANHQLSSWAFLSAQYSYGHFDQAGSSSGSSGLNQHSVTLTLRLTYPFSGSTSDIGEASGFYR